MTAILPNIPSDQYHADAVADVPTPTLSASTACTLISQSPLHAWTAHPRLNPNWKPEDTKDAWDLGTAAHSLLLEGTDRVHVVEGFDNWKTNASKDERDEARANGMIPMLRHQFEEVVAMVDAARAQLEAHSARPALLDAGQPEVTLTCELDGVVCRSRIDWLHDTYATIDDLKTSSRSAEPYKFARNLYDHGYDVRAAFYRRMVKAVTGVDADFRWIVLETKPPYALSVVSPGPDVLALADDKVDKAIALWRECLASGSWPGYDNRVATAELPGWEETRWLERTAA